VLRRCTVPSFCPEVVKSRLTGHRIHHVSTVFQTFSVNPRKPIVDDNEPEPELPKRTSKIAKPARSPATFARKVSTSPPSSFVSPTGRKTAHTSRACTVGPTHTRNRFTAAYEDDELDGTGDLAAMPEEPPKEESISASLPKFELPSGFSFAPVSFSSTFAGVDLTFLNSHPLLPCYLRFPIRYLFAMSRLSVLFPLRSPSPQCRRS
jgi:hypothetical protein